MFTARITYMKQPSQCAEGFDSNAAAWVWLRAKMDELEEAGLLCPDYEFFVDPPANDEVWEDLTRI